MSISAVILASGQASRLGAICKDKPKCLLQFGNIPFLRYLIFWLLNHSIEDVVVTASRTSHSFLIEKELRNNFPESVRLVEEKYTKNTVQSAYVGICEAKNENLLLLTADNLWMINLQQFIQHHLERAAECSVLVTTRKDASNYGMVKYNPLSKRVYSLCNVDAGEDGARASTMGLYALNRGRFLKTVNIMADSYVERESMQRLLPNIWSEVNDRFFFDFGTPKNFEALVKNPQQIIDCFGQPILR